VGAVGAAVRSPEPPAESPDSITVAGRARVEAPGLAGERARLVRLCARLTGDPDAAEDLAQEVLLAAHAQAASLRDPARRGPWLAGIARHLSADWVRRQRRFADLEVERLNVVEPGGTVRLVGSNRERAPDAAVDGQMYKRQGGNPPGLLFYNDEGDECGGLIYGGQRRAGTATGYGAGASLLFDQYKQDQTVGLQYHDSDGERSAGRFVSDWDPAPTLPRLEAIARWEAIRGMPAGPERERGLDELRAGGFFPARRVFVGRERDGAAVVRLCDPQGRVRLRLRVDAAGSPRLELLDEAGGVTHSLPEAIPPGGSSPPSL
jgi:Sigma-70 region 2